jgi:predicted nucleic acid-binding protein
MNDRVFIDTNILVYAHTDVVPDKQLIAQNLIENNNSFISVQVLNELANTLSRKYKIDWTDIEKVLLDCISNNILINNSGTITLAAIALANRYRYSFYDCLIIAAALESNCSILYTEDLTDGQTINGLLTITNPFK